MKRKTKIILLVAAVLLLGFLLAGSAIYSSIQKNMNALSAMETADVPMADIPDGVYSGSYAVFPVAATLEVTIKDHKIASIHLIKHQNGQGKAGEEVLSKVIENDTLQVDTVAGATYSSKVLLKAIENALLAARKP